MALCVRAVALAMYINAWSYYLSLPMAVKQTIPYNDGIYFITFTCYKWMPLVELTDSYDLVYNCFDYKNPRDILLQDMLSCPIMFAH